MDLRDLNFLPFGLSHPSAFPSPADSFRSFDGYGRYTFQELSLDLPKARDELEQIVTAAQAWISHDH